MPLTRQDTSIKVRRLAREAVAAGSAEAPAWITLVLLAGIVLVAAAASWPLLP